MVWIFARESTPELASLVRQLDALSAGSSSPTLHLLVAFVGPDRDELERQAEQLEQQASSSRVLYAIPQRHEIGDRQLRLHDDAEVTVLVAKDRGVTANHATGPGQLDAARIKQVVEDTREAMK